VQSTFGFLDDAVDHQGRTVVIPQGELPASEVWQRPTASKVKCLDALPKHGKPALLTILGYSVNDTVVVSDRKRENLRKYKRMELNELLNLSINETLSRTVLTGLTALVVLVSLYIFGGEVLRNFNFAMLFGVLIGTYSSVFIAAPLLGYLGVKRDWSNVKASTPNAAAKRA
jgi:hypothetical protein